MKKFETHAGQHIRNAAAAIVAARATSGEDMEMSFNDITLTATEGKTAEAIVAEYARECERRSAEYQASPEGQRAAKDAEEQRKIAAASEKEGVLSFAVKDAEEWQKAVAANSDPYGACAMRYAARWAHLMDLELANGAKLEDIAERASHDADKEGITGFMYGCAVSVLSQVWERGEELRLWHNLKSQIGTEGEEANAKGGVLNPAMLTIG